MTEYRIATPTETQRCPAFTRGPSWKALAQIYSHVASVVFPGFTQESETVPSGIPSCVVLVQRNSCWRLSAELSKRGDWRQHPCLAAFRSCYSHLRESNVISKKEHLRLSESKGPATISSMGTPKARLHPFSIQCILAGELAGHSSG